MALAPGDFVTLPFASSKKRCDPSNHTIHRGHIQTDTRLNGRQDSTFLPGAFDHRELEPLRKIPNVYSEITTTTLPEVVITLVSRAGSMAEGIHGSPMGRQISVWGDRQTAPLGLPEPHGTSVGVLSRPSTLRK